MSRTIARTAATLALTLAAVPAALTVAAPAAGAEATLCGTPTVATLFAGQTADAGTVTIGNDVDNNLYVTFDLGSSWSMTQSHLAVADTLAAIPQTQKGMPKIGNFANQRSYSPAVRTDTYVIPSAQLSLDANQSVVIAAHAAVNRLDAAGAVVGTETGWAAGARFVEKGSWATYLGYELQQCQAEVPVVETRTETAFARSATDATCFLDIDADGDGTNDFNRWGWTNGPLAEGDHSMELYAGAGRCDLRKGTDVGKVEVSYHAGTATITFTTEGTNPTTGQRYTMADAQAYAGTAILATNNGEFTVAPGQYTVVDSETRNATTKTFTITGLSGPIHVVAHTSVAGF